MTDTYSICITRERVTIRKGRTGVRSTTTPQLIMAYNRLHAKHGDGCLHELWRDMIRPHKFGHEVRTQANASFTIIPPVVPVCPAPQTRAKPFTLGEANAHRHLYKSPVMRGVWR